jgi:hypothetical protein
VGVDSEFVVAAAQILHEGVAGDHYLRCPIGSQSAHRSQSALELTVIGFYPVVRLLLDVMPRRQHQFFEHRRADRRGRRQPLGQRRPRPAHLQEGLGVALSLPR